MRVYEADRREWAAWDRFNSECECGNVFQTSDFAKALETGGMNVSLIMARAAAGKITGGSFYYVPFKSGIKKMMNKFLVMSGPVLKNIEDKETLGVLLDKITEKAKRCSAFTIELRTPFVKHADIMESRGYIFNEIATSCSFISKLTDAGTAWKNLDKKTRNSIRKAEKEGVVVEDANGPEDIDAMYGLHLARTKDIKDWIPLPQDFFHGIWKVFSGGKRAKFLIARHDGKPIAESIFLCYKDRVHYFNNASLKAYQHLNANGLLVWRTIEWAIKNGYKTLDLYGSPCTPDKSHPQHGLYQFKSGFGGALKKEMQYYFKTVSGTKNFAFEKIFKPVLLPIYKKTRV